MSKAAKTIQIFGIYLIVTGLGFMVIPNKILPIMNVAQATEVWVHVMGMVIFLLGIYYIAAAKDESNTFFKVSVFTRSSVVLFFLAFVLLGLGDPVLIGFGFVDLAGAIWTAVALKADKRIVVE
ncbi:hypothetical protein ACFLU5_08370 [Bacteroidota bacterium]